MDDLHQEKIARKAGSQEEKVSKTSDRFPLSSCFDVTALRGTVTLGRVEYITMKLADIMTRETMTKSAIFDLEKKLTLLEAQLENLGNEMIRREELFDRVRLPASRTKGAGVEQGCLAGGRPAKPAPLRVQPPQHAADLPQSELLCGSRTGAQVRL